MDVLPTPWARVALTKLARPECSWGQAIKAWLVIIFSFFLAVTGAADGATLGASQVEARRAATLWLASIDRGDADASWSSASSQFRRDVGLVAWASVVKSLRGAFGILAQRKEIGAALRTSLPGAPAGQYFVVQFRAVFKGGQECTETVTVRRDEDGKWRVYGFYIS